MTITCAVRPEWRERIAAVVHVDGTARPQIIARGANPLFSDILQRFERDTGLPVLVNTSFNVHEEPIVNRPAECVKALFDGRIDFVVTTQGIYRRTSPRPLLPNKTVVSRRPAMTSERRARRDEGARQRVTIGPGKIGADEPELRLAGIAAGRKRVVRKFAVANRHSVPSRDTAPRNDDAPWCGRTGRG